MPEAIIQHNRLEKFDSASYWNASLSLGYPTVMWRLPNEADFHFLSSFVDVPVQRKIDLDELPAGFAVAPFDNPNGLRTYFLPADLYATFDQQNQLLSADFPADHNQDWQSLQRQIVSKSTATVKQLSLTIPTDDAAKESQLFKESVEKAVGFIRAGGVQKVVLSRKKVYENPDGFDATSLFDKLCGAYKSAFVSAIFLPHLDEIWLGASPEILVSQDEAGRFKTMSLAGTQSVFDASGQPLSEAEAPWRQKEIEEQALVSRYIINCFKKVRVREYEETGPSTVRAGNLMHLRSVFTVNTRAINFPELTSVMLDLLHPTSAVCGMPKAAATKFIRANERHDRELYSGYLGPVNVQGRTDLFVNLRTMKLQDNTATLYAGCGITADSDPEKEWLETEMKCRTIEQVFIP